MKGGKLGNRGLVAKASANLLDVNPRGTLSQKQISTVINTNARAISRCYTEALATDRTASGRVDMQWVVDERGTVGTIKVLFNGMGAPSMARCLRAAIKEFKFPPPTGGPAVVTYPFRFTNPRL